VAWLVHHLFLDCALVGTDLLLVLLCLLYLGHADEPVENKRAEDVEDAVGEEDTFARVSTAKFKGRMKGTYQSCAMLGCIRTRWI
jgi:hypothetical protein